MRFSSALLYALTALTPSQTQRGRAFFAASRQEEHPTGVANNRSEKSLRFVRAPRDLISSMTSRRRKQRFLLTT
jgi:hypothetical protein